MRKLFLILPVILFFASKAFPQAGITLDCPESWGPGRFSKVKVNISFGRPDGFARFTQDLPIGFVVVKDELNGGDFNWNGSQLNIVWMNIPVSKTVSFSYFIKPDNQMQGMIDLGGKVVTVTGGNSKETLTLAERQITIGGNGGLLPEEMNKSVTTQIVTNVTNEDQKSQNHQAVATNGAVYRVQFATSSKDMTGDAMKNKMGVVSKEKITIVRSGEIFKYQLGEFRDKGSAVKLQKQLVSNGIKDAFVVTAR
jgi:hypothetical protein